jgi:hypothetical protein
VRVRIARRDLNGLLRPFERFIDRDSGVKYLPIVPLMDSVTVPERPAWPTNTMLPKDFDKAVDDRLDTIFGKLKQELLPKSGVAKALVSGGLNLAWSLFIRKAVREAVHKIFEDGLRKQGL